MAFAGFGCKYARGGGGGGAQRAQAVTRREESFFTVVTTETISEAEILGTLTEGIFSIVGLPLTSHTDRDAKGEKRVN